MGLEMTFYLRMFSLVLSFGIISFGCSSAEIEKSDAELKRYGRCIRIAPTSGYECVFSDGNPPRCYSHTLVIESAIYGGESKRATDNLKKVCGEGTQSDCSFYASNDVLGYDQATRTIIDPKKGVTKSLTVKYKCMLSRTYTPIGESEDTFQEGQTVRLDCLKKFRTVFTEKGDK